jgi:endonuclease III related protein
MAASRALPQFVGSSSAQKASVSLRDWADFPLHGPASGPALLADSLAPAPLSSYFDALFAANGPQHWWPGRTRFEAIVGAVLTQNTSWTNVERAIRNLRAARLLSQIGIRRVTHAKLAQLLRPSGYFRQKTKTLKSFVDFLYHSYHGSLSKMFSMPTPVLRAQLLNLRGIGPETADSILLYAGKHPVFVVDAYTRRILERHGHAHPKHSYDEIRKLFESSLSPDAQLFNEFHALIVHTGKHFCRKRNPICSDCPLNRFLPLAQTHAMAANAPRRPSAVTSHQSRVTSP